MDSLANYGSDDDCDSGDEKSMNSRNSSQMTSNGAGVSSPASRNCRKPSTSATNASGASDHSDANYDEVQMDLSEDSNDSTRKGRPSTPPPPSCKSRDDHRDRRRGDGGERERRSGSRGRRERDRSHRDSDRRDRHRDYDRDKERDRRDDNRSSRYGRDRRERRQRSRSRERSHRRSRSPRRSRSRSRERRSNFKRFDRATSKLDKLDKMGIELKAPEIPQPPIASPTTDSKADASQQQSRFFMPGISGKFREQIERRKLLWQKKSVPEAKEEAPQPAAAPSSGSSRATKVWECTTFAQDTDGKVANKFKRLMGIKSTDAVAPTEAASDLVKKRQEEMFSSMEQQYEVARSTTHTMRGMGLGFGSFPR